MNILIQIRTYDSFGILSNTLGLMGPFLAMGAPNFGTALKQMDLTACLRSAEPARESFEEVYAQYHQNLQSLPTYVLKRGKQKLIIEFESKVGSAEFVSDHKLEVGSGANFRELKVWPSYRASLFNAFFEEIRRILEALKKKIKKTDDFNLELFFDWLSRKASQLPADDEKLEAISNEINAWYESKRDGMTEWELLDIDWDDFHPSAQSLLDDPFFWDCLDDFSPHGNDSGHDVLQAFIEWRESNRSEPSEIFFSGLMSSWGITEQNMDDKLTGTMYDEAAIALAFAHIKIEGNCPEWAAAQALNAIHRRREQVADLQDTELENRNIEALDKLQSKLQELKK